MPHGGRDPTTGRFTSTRNLDIYPQWLKIPKVNESAAGVYTEGPGVPTGVSRANGIVMEVLGVQWKTNVSGLQALGADLQAQADAQLTTSTQSAIILDDIGDKAIVDTVKWEYAFQFTTSGSAMIFEPVVVWHDFASSGHGPLTAAEEFFLGMIGSGSLTVQAQSARVLYRLVKVGSSELIGMIAQLT